LFAATGELHCAHGTVPYQILEISGSARGKNETPAAMMMEGLRKSRRLFRFLRVELAAHKIKHGDTEIEIQGGMSEREISRTFSKFRQLVKDLREDNIKIITPPGTDLTLPTKPDDKRRRQLP